MSATDISQDKYKVITTNTTTVVSIRPGYLNSITVNTTAAGTIGIFDGITASGTQIGTLKASVAEQTFQYSVNFKVGLTIVTAAASNITVSYR